MKKQTAYLLALGGAGIILLLFTEKGNNLARNIVEIGGSPLEFDLGGFKGPDAIAGYNIQPLRHPTINGVTPSPARSSGSGCCDDCGNGSSRGSSVVYIGSMKRSDLGLNIKSPAYVSPPCIPGTDYEAMAAPGTILGDWYRGPRGLKQKHYSELASAGYSQSVAGWIKYVLDFPNGINGNQNRKDQVSAINGQKPNFQRC